ncbi:hypothetical protein GCM10007940_10820 [Portibacter lacus]|uniref:DUF4157 domain-containing protein n=2 Tax=Portibacter lacus TaxID=1099794 RepID=A0AA37WDW1_9BACT|nr:hypothetical protein GCM10007940_10820 [Portibacter lacus]
MEIARPIFLDSIHWDHIRVNGQNSIAKKFHIAFVSFHSIHFHRGISDPVFIHELVHVWQYEKFGSAYIIRALHAQRTKAGYHYGGELALYDKKRLLEFNFEQMAEIIKDGYLRSGSSSIYNNYIDQLQE